MSDGAKRDDGGTDDGAKAEEENRNSLTRDGERRSFSSSGRKFLFFGVVLGARPLVYK